MILVPQLEGNGLESDPGHCIVILGKFFAMTCAELTILHFVNDLTCLSNHVIIIIIQNYMISLFSLSNVFIVELTDYVVDSLS